MPPATDKLAQNGKDSQRSHGTEDHIDDFFSFIDKYCSEGKFKQLRKISAENETLKADLHKLHTAYDTNIQKLTKYHIQLDADRENFDQQLKGEKARYDKVVKAKQTADDNVKKEVSTVEKLNSRVRAQDEQMKRLLDTMKKQDAEISRLGSTEKSLADALSNAEKEGVKLKQELCARQEKLESITTKCNNAESGLAMFRSFVINLDSLWDKKAEISEVLCNAFTKALKLMEESLSHHLDDTCLRDSTAWGDLRNHVSIHNIVPLPASNSLAAKQMRVAAGLIIYSKALASYIFRPVYITQTNEFDDVLQALEAESSLHESFVRAVLLKILPQSQNISQVKRIDMVVKEVSETLGNLIPPEHQETFNSRLKQVSEEICNTWLVVQQQEERVNPSFTFDVAEDWQPLPTSSTQLVSRTGALSQPLSQQKSQERQGKQNLPEPKLPRREETPRIVWPAFLATVPPQDQEDDTSSTVELVHSGYVLTQDQMKDAEEEVSRRFIRRETRRNGASVPTQKRRRDSGIFFPQ